ncbi:hypothetical protein [Leptobacterium sp. I13]|uniref:Kelch repeat-containing protein n=1 Tax=Leptobacterium meishanense TaxID=3128904 RepID=UPI0030EEEB85
MRLSILILAFLFFSILYSQEKLSVRNAHAMAYNSKTGQTFLFGGASEKEVLNDFWVFENNAWGEIPASNNPSPRTFPGMVYDSGNDRMLLFGGNSVLFGKGDGTPTLLNDIWEYKNTQWTQLTPSSAPSPRSEAAMVYDPNNNSVLLFGGYKIVEGNYIKLGDTWEFKNNEWRLVSEEGPSARNGAVMVYDKKNKNVLLFGGSNVNRDSRYGEGTGETWFWNGEKWSKYEMKQPYNVFNAAMAYDTHKKCMVRFGGWIGKTRINGTFLLKDNEWKELKLDTAPQARNHSDMVYDAKNKRFILYGGHDGENIFGDTWEFKNNTWRLLSETPVLKRVPNNH